ncbi:hypothetical protein C8Q77DRAFT_921559 [Trametes polyzona]|nr:hypothetical protein C8Q77DRAFT_921559 [Trametes polyzona]
MASSVSNAAPQSLVEPPPTPTVTVTASTETFPDSAHAEEPPRPQAGPLPSKRGEIGYVEGVHDRGDAQPEASASTTSLPARHPADRDVPANAAATAATSTPPAANAPRPSSPNGSTDTAGKRSLISFLKPKRIPTYGGLRLTSLSLLLFQLCLFGGTIAGWVLLVQHMARSKPAASPESADASSGASSALSQMSSQIFVHVAFGITALAELIFIERSVFRLRAERYAYIHPGEVLPRSRSPSRDAPPAMAFAPWNRPPLPTYAAALAQSGVGTGDVEDNIIAIPPPPAYGNTRGSTLLLASFMGDAMRSQRSRNSAASTGSRTSRSSRNSRNNGLSPADEGDRPKSYMSIDPEWEEICDADRALRLEETLARLEEGENVGPGARRG